MPKPDEYGDGLLSAHRQPENRFEAHVDADGYVVGGRLLQRNEPADDFWKTIRRSRDAYPIDPIAIVMPPGWPVDEDGRGISVQEYDAYVQHLTTQAKEKAA